MELKSIELAKVNITFSVTDEELDKLSLALSICEITPRTSEEHEAAAFIQKFSSFINEMLGSISKVGE